MLSKYDLTRLVEKAEGMDRKFVLHVGPTNSGKTYQSINALKEAGSGVYLGPLRLMALEVFDKLNAGGCPCTLLTGEEYEPVPDAKVTASTIELCDYQKRYDVAVIDEAQLIGDAARGANWTKAIFAVNAAVVHICMAPEAESLIKHLLEDIQAPYEIVRHERLTPLTFAGKLTRLDDVRPGDALITFSRRGVLSLAAELEKSGRKASVIYGALPPAARREEVRRFESGETSVVVATDAIGLDLTRSEKANTPEASAIARTIPVRTIGIYMGLNFERILECLLSANDMRLSRKKSESGIELFDIFMGNRII